MESQSGPTSTEGKKVTDLQTWKRASIANVPMEILEHVFTFLPREDRLRAMSVCTSWQSLLLSSQKVWHNQEFILKCTLEKNKKKKAELFYCFQNFGPHCQALSVKCRHPVQHSCKKMANQFNLFLKGLRMPELTSIKVYDVQMEGSSKLVIKNICTTLTKMFAGQRPLKVFEMPSAHWPVNEGVGVLETVFQKSGNTLETLNIADYFWCFFDHEWLTTEVLTLNRLKKLSINLLHLTDESIVFLARARRGDLTYLSLFINYVSEFTPRIRQESWIYLVEACPNLEVEFKIAGTVYKPSENIPAILDSVLPVCRLKIEIIEILRFQLQRPGYKMNIVFDYIRENFGQRIRSFKLSVPNNKEYFDQALVKLVRSCPRLLHVKVSASFRSERTAQKIDKIIAERRLPPPTSKGRRSKKVCTESHAVDNASLA
ncbi:F-box only protein 39 [Biomphalaria pfeifferi]|uniref:F-box only protein 39 n=1 Tax=Biomphalaria pfeifferi TaxID=112525 RepID=A0AAD8BAB8_BIOPF|nr:F-box only protein 39 [Biomphalaria pfeifferi]